MTNPPESLPGEATRFTLTVPGLAINDNITIKCLIAPFLQPSVSSNQAYLRVQGDRAAVSLKRTIIKSTFMCI